MSLTLTSPAQTAQVVAGVVVTLQLHWTQNSREVPEKQVKNTDSRNKKQETSKFLNPFTVH